MNKLEEQLQKSRQTEIPDLRPPADGWAAISERLQAPGGATTPGQAAGGDPKISPSPASGIGWNWPLALGGLALTAGLFYGAMQLRNTTPDIAENLPAAVVLNAEQDAANIPPSNKDNTTTTVAPEAIQPEKPEVTSALAPVEAIEKKKEQTPLQELPSGVAATASIEDVNVSTKVTSARTQEETTALVTKVEAQSITPKKSQLEPQDDREPAVEEPTIAEPVEEASQGEQSQQMVETTASKNLSKLIKDQRDFPAAVLPLAVSPTKIMTTPQGFNSLPAISVPPLPEYRRNGKLKVRSEYQLHASLSGFYVEDYHNSSVYERDPVAIGSSRFFTLLTGETVPASFRFSEVNNNLRRSIRLNVGLNRQTSSGFLWRVELGVYHSVNARPRGVSEPIAANQFRLD
ncbi:MAG: hypothetical protein AAF840_05980 [Bacteroidota bacterium]